jgi:DNA-binding IclR family transcriptional regulator
MKRNKEAYENENLAKGLKVLEALEIEPLPMSRIIERTGFSYDFVRRALITLELANYAREIDGKWQLGTKSLTKHI